MMKLKYHTFAIDFDDTIVVGAFPEIGEVKPHAKRVIEKIKDHGGLVSIWTCRSDDHERLVEKWLKDNGIPYDKLNEPFEHYTEFFKGNPRKILADVYIDDKSIDTIVNGGINWLKIEKAIFEVE